MSIRGNAILLHTYAAATWQTMHHDCSSETAKGCSATVSGKNHASSLITATKINLETVSCNDSSANTASFENEREHARSPESADDWWATVSQNSANLRCFGLRHSVAQAIQQLHSAVFFNLRVFIKE